LKLKHKYSAVARLAYRHKTEGSLYYH
jgi:hypothetical protein